MNKKINYICSKCGSDDIRWDAWSYWDIESQSLKFEQAFDETYCLNCKGDCKVKEVELK